MAMKQTQTKLFDFSDVGLDFCAGSKNLFPDRFKKMLALGYNEQTVSSVAVAGNQVTLSYGVSHGYVADRVLKVNAPELLSINGGEFVIDSVTENTVTMTIDGAPASIAGNFTTKVASLGWSLEYENANIHIYKLKDLDESDLYLRLCFQATTSHRNAITPCIGRAVDLVAGVITDAYSLPEGRDALAPAPGFKWEFTSSTGSTHNNYTYSQGLSNYGRGMVIGSLYHFAVMHHTASGGQSAQVVGLFPATVIDYDSIHLPLLIGRVNSTATSSGVSSDQYSDGAAYLGTVSVILDRANSSTQNITTNPQSYTSFLSGSIDLFNTTTAEPIPLYERGTGQFLGMVNGGICKLKYGETNAPSTAVIDSPSQTVDIDFNNKVIIHHIGRGAGASDNTFFAFPFESVKYGN